MKDNIKDTECLICAKGILFKIWNNRDLFSQPVKKMRY